MAQQVIRDVWEEDDKVKVTVTGGAVRFTIHNVFDDGSKLRASITMTRENFDALAAWVKSVPEVEE